MKEAEVHQSEAKHDAQLKGAEVMKMEFAEDELLEQQLEEPPAKRAKVQVQYGIGKWFKPEAKDYKPVVLDQCNGRPNTEMTEALKKAYEKAKEADYERWQVCNFLRQQGHSEAKQTGASSEMLGKRRGSAEFRGTAGGMRSNRRLPGQAPLKKELPAAAKLSIAEDMAKHLPECASLDELYKWAEKKYGLKKATVKKVFQNKDE